MKYIFLDFDGVMNSAYYFMSNDFRRGTAGFTAEEIMLTKVHHTLSPKLVRKVNKLVQDSGAKVIVSSTWRLKYSDDELNEFLRLRDASFTIDGRTPRGNPRRFSQPIMRGDEINAFIKALPDLPEGIVILDDIANMDNLSPYLVLTDDKVGITIEDVQRALDILDTPFVLPPDDDKGNDYLEGFDDEQPIED